MDEQDGAGQGRVGQDGGGQDGGGAGDGAALPDAGADAGPGADPGHGEDPGPLRFHRWMHRSATGAILTGIALGLREALEPVRRNVAIVMEAPGEPEEPEGPITLHFDPDDPTRTVAVVRSAHPPGAPPEAASGADPADA